MPLIETTGSGSAKALGLNSASSAVNYIEDVFSTYLYTGNNTGQTITNGINLSGKGGLVWIKGRANPGTSSHSLIDTVRGRSKMLASNTTAAEVTSSATGDLTSFNSNGFTLGLDENNYVNRLSETYASWTFREQAKFFDVVTYTGTGNNFNNIVSHSLGSLPGFVVYKCTSTTSNWGALARNSAGNYETLRLNTTESSFGAYDATNAGLTSTTFNPGKVWGNETNDSGQTYVAYLFAHNAGGFGLAGSDNVISCGSATCSGGIATINLGYEPQWILAKQTNTTGDWRMIDNMRGWTNNSSGNQTGLQSNTTAAETTYGWGDTLSPTGCNLYGGASDTFIYIAIRRGPMKTPTTGTSVYTGNAYSGSGATRTFTNIGFPIDLSLTFRQDASRTQNIWADRLRGLFADGASAFMPLLSSASTAAENTGVTNAINAASNVGYTLYNAYSQMNASSINYISWNFRRAPGFMDVVCYTGTNNDIALTHNLGVAPEAIILKKRNGAGDWAYETNFTSTQHTSFTFNGTIAGQAWNYSSGVVLTAQPTSTTVTVAGGAYSTSGSTYVMYLFASCPGVSKVGSYSGTGGTQTISCGFAARFVMIKRTDSTGSWWVWDTARGMVAGTDPRLAQNDLNAEINANWVYTDASGFQIVTTDATVNASGGSYIYLAIA